MTTSALDTFGGEMANRATFGERHQSFVVFGVSDQSGLGSICAK